MIKLRYSSVDGFRQTKSFKTLNGARKFAQHWIGKTPEIGSTYAVSGDGIGKIEVIEGAALKELFGDEPVAGAMPSGEFTIYVVAKLSTYFATREEAEAAIKALPHEGYGRFQIEERLVSAEDFWNPTEPASNS